MKRIIACALLLLMSVAHAEDLEVQYAKAVEDSRAAIVKQLGPYQDDATVAGLVVALGIHDVEVLVSKQAVPGTALYYPGVIIVGAELLNQPRAAMAMVLAHEYGHHVHAHWRQSLALGMAYAEKQGRAKPDVMELAGFVMQAQSKAYNHRIEYEADAFAVQALKSSRLLDRDAVVALLNKIGKDECESHPSAADRIQAMTF